jgi:prepilin-type N-terminal cleavage/methylation domain-containing protein
MTAPSSRRGFTLVELLVVTGLLAGFFGLLVAGLRPNANSQVRQLSQTLSSALLATQTRALGNESGGALFLDVTSGNVFTNMIFFTDMPPFIVGTVASGVPPATLSATTTTGTLAPTNADAPDLAFGYRIQFFGTNPYIPPTSWMAFSSPGTTLSGTVGFRSASSQSTHNTVWPTIPSGAPLQFKIARYPVKSTSALDTTKQAAVDLRYSGIGNTVSGNYGSLHNKGPIAITFDRNGGLDTVMQYGSGSTPSVDPVNPTAPLYLLIASLSDIQDNRSLQSPTSRWLAITPSTGRVTVAANLVVSGTLENDVVNARANARQGVTGGIK